MTHTTNEIQSPKPQDGIKSFIYTVFQKGDTPTRIDNLVNSQRIFKILSQADSQKICNKTIIKDPTTQKNVTLHYLVKYKFQKLLEPKQSNGLKKM